MDIVNKMNHKVAHYVNARVTQSGRVSGYGVRAQKGDYQHEGDEYEPCRFHKLQLLEEFV